MHGRSFMGVYLNPCKIRSQMSNYTHIKLLEAPIHALVLEHPFLAHAFTVFDIFICCFFHNENFFFLRYMSVCMYPCMYVCMYIYIYIYIYIGDSRCAVVRYDTVLRRTRQCSNRSRLLQF